MTARIAIIGGSGLNQFKGAKLVAQHEIETPYGTPSALIDEVAVSGCHFLFMPRHGVGHHIPPHRINYRANMAALHQMGVDRVIACNAVGGISEAMAPAVLVLPDQIIDYTWGREQTFSDGTEPGVAVNHVDFTHPYSESMNTSLARCAASLQLDIISGATYACTQGPRLESAAEIRRLARDGCDIVGMTAMPEAALARELAIDYASVCLVVNWGAGLTEDLITLESMNTVIHQGMGRVRELIGTWLMTQR